MGSLATSNTLKDDLLFNLEYVRCLDGVTNLRDRTFKTSFCNSRKLSQAFTGGQGFEEVVPPMLVDRDCLNATITENFTRQSTLTYGVVLEIRHENKQVSATGLLLMPYSVKNLRNRIFKTSFFNSRRGPGFEEVVPPMFVDRDCLKATITELKQVGEGFGNPQPPVLVLHGHYGGCIGNLPSYDAFVLGGLNSVRGYNMGELDAAKNIPKPYIRRSSTPAQNTPSSHLEIHLYTL